MMNKKRFSSLSDLISLAFILAFLGLIVYGFVTNNQINKSIDQEAKEELKEIQTALESYFVTNEVYPKDSTWQKDIKNNYKETIKKEYVYDADGSGTGCYTLSYTLLNTKDSGPNIESGVYTLECKQ